MKEKQDIGAVLAIGLIWQCIAMWSIISALKACN